MSTTAIERWDRYVDQLPWERGHLDESSWNAFLRAGSLGIDPQNATGRISARIQQAGGHLRQSKVAQQLARAYQYARQHTDEVIVPKQPKPEYDLKALEQLAARLDAEVDETWVEARSPVTCWNRTPAGALHKLFRPGEKIIVFTNFRSQGCYIWQHPGPVGDLSILNHLQRGCENGVWFLANPVNGEWRELDRLRTEYNPQGRTRRAEENILSWRYAVVESDKAPTPLWLKVLVQLPLPIAAVTTSGGASVHALIRVDAESKSEWDSLVRQKLLPPLTRLGADPAAMTAVRLTRLPNCHREEKDALQRLLYLDPESGLTPICKR
jgi:hypothetical protein